MYDTHPGVSDDEVSSTQILRTAEDAVEDEVKQIARHAEVRLHCNDPIGEMWVFEDKALDIVAGHKTNLRSSSLARSQLDHIAALKRNWRPNTEPLRIPKSWKMSDAQSALPIHELLRATDIAELPNLFLRLLLQRMDQKLGFIERDEVLRRNKDSQSTDADFMLPRDRIPGSGTSNSGEDSGSNATSHSEKQALALLSYRGGESAADAVLSFCVGGADRCWLLSEPLYAFPSSLSYDLRHRPAFALVRNRIIPNSVEGFELDKRLPVTIQRPALLVGIKHSIEWNNASDQLSSRRNAALASHSSLSALLLAHQRVEGDNSKLPHWMFTFGLIFDAGYLEIIAHLPFYDDQVKHFRFVSHFVDRIPLVAVGNFSPLHEPHEAVTQLESVRILLALLTLTKHCSRIASFCDDVNFPGAITDAEEIWENELLQSGSGSNSDEEYEEEDDF